MLKLRFSSLCDWRQQIEKDNQKEAPDSNVFFSNVTLERYTMFMLRFYLCDKNIILKNNKPGFKSNLNTHFFKKETGL